MRPAQNTASCPGCGEPFRRDLDRHGHRCPPNDTGLAPGDTVRVGAGTGVVLQVSRSAVEVYFRASFQARWYTATEVERVAA